MTKGEYFRKPGHEVQKHRPEMWFVTPTAARWGNDGEANKWLEHHAECIEHVQAMKDGAYDFLQKPFAPDVLRAKVREVLDTPPAVPAA